MSDPAPFEPYGQGPHRREPILNLPGVVTTLSLLLIAIHAIFAWGLSRQAELDMLVTFAFLPARYAGTFPHGAVLPGGEAADVWTFVTYAFLHGSWTHVFINVIWMIVFGSALARRIGTMRFLLLSALCAVGGAALHLYVYFGEPIPMIGASAAISGQMAAATRFVFQPGGPLGVPRGSEPAAYRVPASGLIMSLANPRVAMFVIVWFGINLLFGLFTSGLAGAGSAIAWEAHIGGFVAGFLLFSLFDTVSSRGR